MKRESTGPVRGEGWLIAAALAAVALFFLLIWMNRLPRSIAVEPVLSVPEENVLVNLNTAGEGELARLPGIGEELAGRIVEYRDVNGPFASADDLDAVSGIGAGKIAAIEKLVFCG